MATSNLVRLTVFPSKAYQICFPSEPDNNHNTFYPLLVSIPPPLPSLTCPLFWSFIIDQIFSSDISVFTDISCFSHCLIRVNITNYLTLCTYLLFFPDSFVLLQYTLEEFCQRAFLENTFWKYLFIPENIFVLLSCLVDHFTCIWNPVFKITFFQHFEIITRLLCFWCQSNSWFFPGDPFVFLETCRISCLWFPRTSVRLSCNVHI